VEYDSLVAAVIGGFRSPCSETVGGEGGEPCSTGEEQLHSNQLRGRNETIIFIQRKKLIVPKVIYQKSFIPKSWYQPLAQNQLLFQ